MIQTKTVTAILAALMIAASPAGAAAEKSEGADKPEHPQEMVKTVTDKVLAALREDDGKENGVSEHVRELILPHLDFVAMSKLVLGKHWRGADEQQREAFVEQFKQLLIRTYETSLTEYSNEKVEFLQFRESNKPDKLAVVKSQIKRSGGPSIPINYNLRYKESDGWKVYDIGIEGVSLVTNYRSSFSRKINRKGLDALIESLEERNRKGEIPDSAPGVGG